MLEKINSNKDLKKLSIDDLTELCKDLRNKIIDVVSKNGGHLASNLGVVELTVAIHKVFNLPKDKLIWDVGHQCYTHKILTARKDKIDSIRKQGGISGFPKRNESVYDAFNVGHSSTSISAAYGIKKAGDIMNQDGYTIAVIGDGALSGGLAYEGLNNSGRYKKNFIVILNDNKMSISRNVGSMSRYLTRIRMKPTYLKIKEKVEWVLNHTPFIGKYIRNLMLRSKSLLKNMIYKSTIFEELGFVYYGPLDGHNIGSLIKAFEFAKKINSPVLIHVKTKKGRGYKFAEKNPKDFHGISKFDVNTGVKFSAGTNFSDVFGKAMCKLAAKDSRIIAITAAMKLGTGLKEFSKVYKKRFFDVGIAEEHAVTFAAGLASQGVLPVFAVYSSFLQRAYDEILHDAAMQNLNVTLAVDRAGIVGEDGETHQGIFDVSFLNGMPNVKIFCPTFYNELEFMLEHAIYDLSGVKVIRYPKGIEPDHIDGFEPSFSNFDIYAGRKKDIVIVTYGRLFSEACKAKKKLENLGMDVYVLKFNMIKPLDIMAIDFLMDFKNVFFFEEGMRRGGIGETIAYELLQRNFKGIYNLNAIDDFVPQASVSNAISFLRLDAKGMVNAVRSRCRYG